jgi:tight adherence protein C
METLLANPIAISSLVFLTFILAGLGIAGLITRGDHAVSRMREIGRAGTVATEADDAQAFSLTYEDSRPAALRMLEPLQKKLAQSDPKQVSAARQRLVEAGYYRPSAVETYFTLRVILGLALPLVAIIATFTLYASWPMLQKLLAILGASAAGYYLPAMAVSARITDRQNKFKLGMPDALDMMLIGVEAGLSLSASMKHVVKEFAHVHPIVAEQFQIVSLEFQAGRSRTEALNGLARRMNIPVTRTLATMIAQSEQLGTSMSQTLQVMAQELRMQRMLDAEKTASELPVKMSVPLVLCIFPALMAIALVPAILGVLSFFKGLG